MTRAKSIAKLGHNFVLYNAELNETMRQRKTLGTWVFAQTN